LSLKAPGGWHVVPVGPVAQAQVAPTKAVTVKFAVTPPAWAVAQYVTLHGTAELTGGECAGTDTHCGARREGGETVLVGP
jgi:hypothetical protein